VSRPRLGDILVRSGLLSQEQLEFALREQARSGVRLGQILVDHGMVEESKLYDALARVTGLPRLSLQTIEVDRIAANMVDADWAQRFGMLPVARDQIAKILVLAVTDPTDLGPLDELSFKTGFRVRAVLGSETEVGRLIRHHFFGDVLKRDTGDLFYRPGHPTTGRIEIEDRMIIRGMESMRNELQGTTEDVLQQQHEKEALEILKPIFDAQQDAARTLKAIFEMCVARGIIDPAEYFEKLRQMPDE
jgi:type IV pilus assembly protein PilB